MNLTTALTTFIIKFKYKNAIHLFMSFRLHVFTLMLARFSSRFAGLQFTLNPMQSDSIKVVLNF